MEQNRKIHSITDNTTSTSSMSTKPLVMLILGMIVLGVASGFLISKMPSGGASSTTTKNETTETDGKTTAGILDKKAFPDSAEGTLKEGGIEGEGSYHLVRPGGDSQNVYLTSTAVDLSTFIGKKVKVWGKTFDSQKAGWLMDVGYVEVSK